MHKSLATSAFALAIFFSPQIASATDILSGDTNPAGYAQPYQPAFQGLGIGLQGGGQFTAIDIAGEFDGVSADGLVGGAHAEYLFAAGRFRVGPYVEGGLSNVNTEIGGGDLLEQDHYYGGGLKLGVLAGSSTLVYARGGYEWAGWSTDAADIDIDVESYVIGGGVETMLTDHVSVGLGVDYLVPADVSVGDFDATDLVDDSEQLRAMARITWRQ